MNLTVTNRQLLRDYKNLKDQLLRKKITTITVKLDEGHLLEIKLRRKKRVKTPFEQACEMAKNKPFHVTRPQADLFDYI